MRNPRKALKRIRKKADRASLMIDLGPLSDEDWELCATAARVTVPRLVNALEGVLAMHAPKDNGRVTMCCSCEQWIESSDDEACIEYPCPTVEAITEALERAA